MALRVGMWNDSLKKKGVSWKLLESGKELKV